MDDSTYFILTGGVLFMVAIGAIGAPFCRTRSGYYGYLLCVFSVALFGVMYMLDFVGR